MGNRQKRSHQISALDLAEKQNGRLYKVNPFSSNTQGEPTLQLLSFLPHIPLQLFL